MKKIIALFLVSFFAVGCSKSGAPVADSVAGKASPPFAKSQVAAPAAAIAHDGPFGLGMGLSIKELADLKMLPSDHSPGLYVGEPPRPVTGIDTVVVQAAPKAGLCKILASVTVGTVNGSGDQVKTEVDRLAEAIATKYGAHSKKKLTMSVMGPLGEIQICG